MMAFELPQLWRKFLAQLNTFNLKKLLTPSTETKLNRLIGSRKSSDKSENLVFSKKVVT